MKLFYTLLFYFPALVFAQEATDYQSLFYQQIKNSCQDQKVWQKSVEEFENGISKGLEVQQFTFDCNQGKLIEKKEDSELSPGLSEFNFLFEYYCLDPYQKDYFEIENSKQGLIAKLKTDQESPLLAQTFFLNETGIITMAHSHIHKENSLYTLDVNIRVEFDTLGRYLRHEVTTFTEPLLSEGLKTIVRGELIL